MPRDPHQVLDVAPGVSDEELHDAYRRLVKRHHPDRNGGSEEATRRFQEIQQAYDELRDLRARGAAPRAATAPPPPGDPAVEVRMADLERELREAQAARERARQAARDAMRETTGRPSDEELGYYSTDDSFTKILTDMRDEVSSRVSGAREHPAVRRVRELLDGLEGLTGPSDDKRR